MPGAATPADFQANIVQQNQQLSQQGNTGGAGAGTGTDPAPKQPKAQSPQQQFNTLLKSLTYQQAYGSGAEVQSLASQMAQLIQQMPVSEGTSLLSKIPSGSPLSTAVQGAISGTSSTGSTQQQPVWDPLALQSIYATVLQPMFQAANQMAGGSSNSYLQNMNQLISGSNQPAGVKAADSHQANAMAQLLAASGKASQAQAPATLGFDTLIQALQNASSSASLAQGEAQKAIAYGTNTNAAQAFANPSGGSTAGGAISPLLASSLLQGALTGTQTSNPLTPNFGSAGASAGILP